MTAYPVDVPASVEECDELLEAYRKLLGTTTTPRMVALTWRAINRVLDTRNDLVAEKTGGP